jgi:K+-transporting ATPase ATPase A chain
VDLYGWIQLFFYVVILASLTRPMGIFLVRVLDADGKTFLDPALKLVERLLYRLLRLDPKNEQDWKQYTLSLLSASWGYCSPTSFSGFKISCLSTPKDLGR